ncbi:PepSY-associated TM helix domain-containing protein [Flavobacterium sp.]|uniref:PepSY-associated TM helix domain-containing protein n=1 Tax=Flavobacterium sp. TaxID=239 RepID=UPI003D115545
MKNTIKGKFRKIHLWLGLTSGLIVFIVALTGALYAFKNEIEAVCKEQHLIDSKEKKLLPPSKLKSIVEKEIPNKKVHAIQYHEATEPAEVILYNAAPKYHYIVSLNPYSGKVLHIKNEEEGFFHFIFQGHMYLWLPQALGQIVAATATLLFLFLVITGLVLWYPKRKKELKKRVWFRWKEDIKWKRKNFDLHSIIGFYVSLLALIFIITGLAWGFPWFGYLYYKAIGGEKSVLYVDPVSSKQKTIDSIPSIDKAFYIMKVEYQSAKSIEIHPPETDSTSIACNANSEKETYWKTDYRYFDQYTLEEKSVDLVWGRFAKADNSDKLLRMNYDIHTGAIAGLAGKTFAFLISLLIASLPVTGFLIWWGRKNK